MRYLTVTTVDWRILREESVCEPCMQPNLCLCGLNAHTLETKLRS